MSLTKTIDVDKGTVLSLTTSGGSGQGCGKNKRLYVGRDGDRLYRSLLKFDPAWSADVGKIIKATLVLYDDDGFGGRFSPYVTSDTPKIRVYRLTDAFTEGNNADEVFNSSDFTEAAKSTSNGRAATMTKAANEATEIDVTGIFRDFAPKRVQGSGKKEDHGIVLWPASTSVGDAWSGWSEDYTGDTSKRPVVELEYEPGLTDPDVPSNLTPTGSVPALEAFEGDFTDDDVTDRLAYKQVEVYRADGTTLVYTSSKYPASQTEQSNARFHLPADLTLTADLTYRWRARVWDQDGSVSAWSSLISFSVANNPPHITSLFPPDIEVASFAGLLFGGEFDDADDDPPDGFLAYQIQMGREIEGTVGWTTPSLLNWDTGKRAVEAGQTELAVLYGGEGANQGDYQYRIRVWDTRNGVSAWEYGDITLTEDFTAQPGLQEGIFINAFSPWRIVIKDMEFAVSPDIALVQSKTGADSVTLDDDPEFGNLILVWATVPGQNPTHGVLPAGFTNIAAVRSGNNANWGRMSYTYSDGNAPTVAVPDAVITVMEWRAVYAKQFRGVNHHASTTAFRAGGNIKPSKGIPAELVGGGVWPFESNDGGSTTLSELGSTDEIDETDSDGIVHWVGARYLPNPDGHNHNLGGTLGLPTNYGGVTVVLHKRNPSRGPGEVLAILEDAKSTGANEMFNSPGECHFTIPIDHPQIDVIEPKQVHYEVQFYSDDGWRGTFFGLMWDLDAADDQNAVFTGIDYLGLFDTQMDMRFDVNNINKSEAKGGSKYVNKTITYILTKALNRAINAPNSPVNFISLGDIDTMDERVTIWSTAVPTLQFATGLIDSHRQGTGKNSRIWVRPLSGGTAFEVRVDEDPGRERPDIRMRYGELVNGYRVIFFGPNWKTTTGGVGRTRTGSKVYYTTATAPGLDPSTWGAVMQAQLFDGVSDLKDLKRRVKQAALTAGKLGSHLALKIRQGLLQPKQGFDVADHIPVEVREGITDTTRFGSGFYTIYGIAWEAGGESGTDSSNDLILSLLPRNDVVPPDDDLVDSVETTGVPAYATGFGPPDENQTADFYLDLNTGILYQKDPDGTDADDYVDVNDGAIVDDEGDQPDPDEP